MHERLPSSVVATGLASAIGLVGVLGLGCSSDSPATDAASGGAAPLRPGPATSDGMPGAGGTSSADATAEGVSGTEGGESVPADAMLDDAEAAEADAAAPVADAASGSVEPALHFVGRMDTTDPAGPRFAWSGSGVVANFSGSEVTLQLDDSGSNELTVLLDGELAPTLVATAGPSEYVLATGLAPGEHRIEIYRRTEALFGPSQFLGLDFGADGALLPPPTITRRIEIVGDSVSAGYGNEGTAPCGLTSDTENHYLTYGAIAARELGAELSTVAWSGKGVVYNYDTDVTDPMPTLFERTLPADPTSVYDFAIAPDVVLINLGTNDFSTDGDPDIELFAGEYSQLLQRIRAVYPDAFISCTVGPLLSGADLTAARAGIVAGVEAFEAAGGSNVEAWEMTVPNGDPPGCDFHPNLATHRAMADAVIAQLAPAFD